MSDYIFKKLNINSLTSAIRQYIDNTPHGNKAKPGRWSQGGLSTFVADLRAILKNAALEEKQNGILAGANNLAAAAPASSQPLPIPTQADDIDNETKQKQEQKQTLSNNSKKQAKEEEPLELSDETFAELYFALRSRDMRRSRSTKTKNSQSTKLQSALGTAEDLDIWKKRVDIEALDTIILFMQEHGFCSLKHFRYLLDSISSSATNYKYNISNLYQAMAKALVIFSEKGNRIAPRKLYIKEFSFRWSNTFELLLQNVKHLPFIDHIAQFISTLKKAGIEESIARSYFEHTEFTSSFSDVIDANNDKSLAQQHMAIGIMLRAHAQAIITLKKNKLLSDGNIHLISSYPEISDIIARELAKGICADDIVLAQKLDEIEKRFMQLGEKDHNYFYLGQEADALALDALGLGQPKDKFTVRAQQIRKKFSIADLGPDDNKDNAQEESKTKLLDEGKSTQGIYIHEIPLKPELAKDKSKTVKWVITKRKKYITKAQVWCTPELAKKFIEHFPRKHYDLHTTPVLEILEIQIAHILQEFDRQAAKHNGLSQRDKDIKRIVLFLKGYIPTLKQASKLINATITANPIDCLDFLSSQLAALKAEMLTLNAKISKEQKISSSEKDNLLVGLYRFPDTAANKLDVFIKQLADLKNSPPTQDQVRQLFSEQNEGGVEQSLGQFLADLTQSLIRAGIDDIKNLPSIKYSPISQSAHRHHALRRLSTAKMEAERRHALAGQIENNTVTSYQVDEEIKREEKDRERLLSLEDYIDINSPKELDEALCFFTGLSTQARKKKALWKWALIAAGGLIAVIIEAIHAFILRPIGLAIAIAASVVMPILATVMKIFTLNLPTEGYFTAINQFFGAIHRKLSITCWIKNKVKAMYQRTDTDSNPTAKLQQKIADHAKGSAINEVETALTHGINWLGEKAGNVFAGMLKHLYHFATDVRYLWNSSAQTKQNKTTVAIKKVDHLIEKSRYSLQLQFAECLRNRDTDPNYHLLKKHGINPDKTHQLIKDLERNGISVPLDVLVKILIAVPDLLAVPMITNAPGVSLTFGSVAALAAICTTIPAIAGTLGVVGKTLVAANLWTAKSVMGKIIPFPTSVLFINVTANGVSPFVLWKFLSLLTELFISLVLKDLRSLKQVFANPEFIFLGTLALITCGAMLGPLFPQIISAIPGGHGIAMAWEKMLHAIEKLPHNVHLHDFTKNFGHGMLAKGANALAGNLPIVPIYLMQFFIEEANTLPNAMPVVNLLEYMFLGLKFGILAHTLLTGQHKGIQKPTDINKIIIALAKRDIININSTKEKIVAIKEVLAQFGVCEEDMSTSSELFQQITEFTDGITPEEYEKFRKEADRSIAVIKKNIARAKAKETPLDKARDDLEACMHKATQAFNAINTENRLNRDTVEYFYDNLHQKFDKYNEEARKIGRLDLQIDKREYLRGFYNKFLYTGSVNLWRVMINIPLIRELVYTKRAIMYMYASQTNAYTKMERIEGSFHKDAAILLVYIGGLALRPGRGVAMLINELSRFSVIGPWALAGAILPAIIYGAVKLWDVIFGTHGTEALRNWYRDGTHYHNQEKEYHNFLNKASKVLFGMGNGFINRNDIDPEVLRDTFNSLGDFANTAKSLFANLFSEFFYLHNEFSSLNPRAGDFFFAGFLGLLFATSFTLARLLGFAIRIAALVTVPLLKITFKGLVGFLALLVTPLFSVISTIAIAVFTLLPMSIYFFARSIWQKDWQTNWSLFSKSIKLAFKNFSNLLGPIFSFVKVPALMLAQSVWQLGKIVIAPVLALATAAASIIAIVPALLMTVPALLASACTKSWSPISKLWSKTGNSVWNTPGNMAKIILKGASKLWAASWTCIKKAYNLEFVKNVLFGVKLHHTNEAVPLQKMMAKHARKAATNSDDFLANAAALRERFAKERLGLNKASEAMEGRTNKLNSYVNVFAQGKDFNLVERQLLQRISNVINSRGYSAQEQIVLFNSIKEQYISRHPKSARRFENLFSQLLLLENEAAMRILKAAYEKHTKDKEFSDAEQKALDAIKQILDSDSMPTLQKIAECNSIYQALLKNSEESEKIESLMFNILRPDVVLGSAFEPSCNAAPTSDDPDDEKGGVVDNDDQASPVKPIQGMGVRLFSGALVPAQNDRQTSTHSTVAQSVIKDHLGQVGLV